MSLKFYLIVLTLSGSVCAQLELPEEVLDPPESPTEPLEPESVDEEAVRALTRQMQARPRVAPPPEVPEDHPGREHVSTVLSRLQAGPSQVQITVTLQNGKTFSGIAHNQLLEVSTAVGTFPITWSEIQTVENFASDSRFLLREGDQLQGSLSLRELALERLDTSMVMVPLHSFRSIAVVPLDN